MEQSVVSILSNYVPMVQRYQSQFSSLNTLLSKTTLTGKISSLDIAENLFDYMERTQEKFENLQDELIHTIMEQNFHNAYEEALTSARLIGNIVGAFIGGCHENILELSKNENLHNFAVNFAGAVEKEKSKESLSQLLEILQNFGKKSQNSYKDIFLFGNDGALLECLKYVDKQENNIKTKLQSVLDSNKVGSYAEYYQKVDFYYKREDALDDDLELFFVIPLREGKESAVSVTAVFVVNIQEKIKEILEQFPYRLPQGHLVVLSEREHIVFSDNVRTFPIGQLLAFNKHQEYTFLESRSKTCMVAFGKVSGLEHLESVIKNCNVCRIVPLYAAFDAKRQINREIDNSLLEDSLLVTEELDRVIAEGENINEELGDVVINGEIIASKSHSYALNPILNNIRILSEEMNTLCVQSTGELQRGIYSTLFNIVEYYSRYLVFATDMLFAKLIRDVEQISNNAEFIAYLSKVEQEGVVESTIKGRLASLEQDFSYFHNVALFDKDGMILLNGLDDNILNKKKISFYGLTTNASDVVVSSFEPTFLYGDKPTILMYSYLKDSAHRLVGGLVFVLDFARIGDFLNQVLPKESKIVAEESEIFSVVFDDNKNILATTKSDFRFDEFLQNDVIDFKNLKKMNKIVKIEQKYYLVCSDVCNVQQSVFTEYTRRTLHAVIFVAVKEDKID
ncbi:cache domain-containing protein [Helicobacter turcicus]|uniref:Cache domain-containing protein n=1 Tax=Helicobacter turcicus TaxID=2867412 RepID=A0ABS7JKK4_9HELI|nr:cache domain-containing protein [Helicobacter turcicus]MBX7489911.1 cache domain-containing protein [Helicobacter turcicus]MBX7544771.1 cache domain-containing protein [Helicobacter turcicus]